jgi:hypothetical protein
MMANAAYREALVHRYAGLERTILLQMQADARPAGKEAWQCLSRGWTGCPWRTRSSI